MRWALLLTEYPEAIIKYKPGIKNSVADALSRLPSDIVDNDDYQIPVMNLISFDNHLNKGDASRGQFLQEED